MQHKGIGLLINLILELYIYNLWPTPSKVNSQSALWRSTMACDTKSSLQMEMRSISICTCACVCITYHSLHKIIKRQLSTMEWLLLYVYPPSQLPGVLGHKLISNVCIQKREPAEQGSHSSILSLYVIIDKKYLVVLIDAL